LHEKEDKEQISRQFRKDKYGLYGGFAFQTILSDHMKALDLIADYYGERFAFYFAWLLHYTHWLIYPSVIGAFFYLIQVS
jgi:hypothetical protein